MIELSIVPVRISLAVIGYGSLCLNVQAQISTAVSGLFIHEFPVHVLARD